MMKKQTTIAQKPGQAQPKIMTKSSQYQAYLIRFSRHDIHSRWRATLTNAQTNEVRHFATEQEALRFILTNLAEPSQPQSAPKS